MFFGNFVLLIAAFSLQSCVSTKITPLGSLSFVSTKNINEDRFFRTKKLSSSYLTEKQMGKSKKMRNNNDMEVAVNDLINKTPGGLYVMNARPYYVQKSVSFGSILFAQYNYYVVNGDVYGIKGVEQNVQGFKRGDRVTWKGLFGKINKGKITSFVGLEEAIIKRDDGEEVHVDVSKLSKIR